MDKLAWYLKNSNGQTQRVGTRQPNGLGLFDMSGNVYEWSQDRQQVNLGTRPVPTGGTQPLIEEHGVYRGGGWDSPLRKVRTDYRRTGHPEDYRADDLGFRVLLPAPAAAD